MNATTTRIIFMLKYELYALIRNTTRAKSQYRCTHNKLTQI